MAAAAIPIVGIGTFRAGAYASLAQPGCNVTGVEGSLGNEFYAKHVQLLHDAVPTASRIAWLGKRAAWDGVIGAAVRAGAEQLGLTLVPVIVDSPVNEATIRQAFNAMARQSFDAIYVAPSTDVYAHRRLVAKLVAATRLPAVGRQRQYAEAVQRWQRRLNQLWNRIGGGCNLDRDIPGLNEGAGFRVDSLDSMYPPRTPRFAGFNLLHLAHLDASRRKIGQ